MTIYLRDPEPVRRPDHPLVGLSFCALSVVAVLALALHVSVVALECGLAAIAMLSLAGLVYGSLR